MRVLLDHNVPISVADVFREFGHFVQLVSEILPTNSPDPLVAAVSEDDGSVLVSCDTDFNLIAPRIPKGTRARFRKLSRISLACGEPQATQRVREAMTLIQTEFQIAQNRPDKRMMIVIQKLGSKRFGKKGNTSAWLVLR